MANGERCIHCHFQQMQHEYRVPGTCKTFVSEITHNEKCPILGCDGDCEKTIEKHNQRVAETRWRSENLLLVLPGRGVLRLNIGS